MEIAASTPPVVTVDAAYAACRRLARHYENFPVASLLVPRRQRDALAAIYAFARYADDLADEPEAGSAQQRLDGLRDWRSRLLDCYAGEARHPVFIALGDAARRFGLPCVHFENLLQAFEQDVTVNRYPTFDALLGYCQCSANPVGRLVLELFGHHEPELAELSDCICTGLQLANFWQDVAIDLKRDRIYLPLEDLERYGYSISDLRAQTADGRWQRLMALELERTRDLFARGCPLPDQVAPELRTQTRLTWLGGMTILDKIERAGYDVFRRRPKLRGWDFAWLYLKARASAAT